MKKIILISLCAVMLLSVIAGSAVLYFRLLHLDTYRDEIIKAVQNSLKRRVTYEYGAFSLKYGPSFTFTKLVIMERDGKSIFASSDRLAVKIALLPLLGKKVLIKKIQLEKPRFSLIRYPDGAFNCSDILEGSKDEVALRVETIRIRSGSVSLDDRAAGRGVATTLANLDFSVNHVTRGKSSDFDLTATILEKGRDSTFSSKGKVRLPPKGKPLSDSYFTIKIAADDLNAAHYWDYYSPYVPFRKILGRVNIDSTFKGRIYDFSSRGTMTVTNLFFDFPGVFHSTITPKEVQIKYDMELAPNGIDVKHLAVKVDNLAVNGSCTLKDIHSGDLFIAAKATTGTFRLEEFGKYIPYGIIPNDTSEFIEQHIRGGAYRLEEGTLKGRISQIAHMERGTNYNVLSIRGTVEDGLVAFGSDTPTFNGIRGNLALRGKDFILSGMDGRFGESPFTLEGRITDYPIDAPCSYPFTMKMTPAQHDVAWLLERGKRGKLSFSGPSALFLSGNGQTSNYLLSGKWDLTSAAYKHSDIISKPAGQVNSLTFSGSISKEEAKLAAFHYTLNSLSLAATAIYPFAGEKPIGFFVNSNQFTIHDVAPMVPRIVKFTPRGKVKASIQGKISGREPENLSLSGDILLAGVSLKPSEKMKYVENVNGTVRFAENTLSTSMLTAKFGNSTFSASGSVSGFRNPSMDIAFSIPLLDFSDIGIGGKAKTVTARKVQGSVVYKDRNVRIRNLTAQINKSILEVHGTIEDIRNPKVDVAITSPYLELDDIMFLQYPEPGKGRDRPRAAYSGQVTIDVDSGKVKQFAFEKLRTAVKLEDGIAYIQPMHVNALGGSASAKGVADFSKAGNPKYQMAFDIKDISAVQLMQSLQAEREMTGAISLQGEVTAGGNDFGSLKKTASGNVELECTEGSLRKFAVLSKIFSILNVSQLLKFKLPDMVSGGMPYNKITGTFALRNGVIETTDLFIDSDAMNISVIGTWDLPKEKLDLTVGVKPLQTVDKVLSRIPIAGWILTGKNKSLVTAYFEAKGSWGNPQVNAIPVKSLAKGVFGIFKRVFQLPAKLITNTGEVIIGK